MRKYLVLILLVVVIFSVTGQLKAVNVDNKNMLEYFNELEMEFYSGVLSLENLEEKTKIFIDDLNNKEDDYLKFYYRGRSYFILGEIAGFQNEEEKAINYYESAKKSTEKAMEYKESSNVYNMLGKIYIRLLNKKGAFYAIRNGQKTFDLINKAIELDEKNYSAYNSLGIIYLQAPKIGGGDITKSEEAFEKALNSNEKIDNFISYYYLFKVYKEIEDKNSMKDYRDKAEKIFPDSYFLKNN